MISTKYDDLLPVGDTCTLGCEECDRCAFCEENSLYLCDNCGECEYL